MRGRLAQLGRRLLGAVPVVLLATFLVYGMMQLVPGDPAVTLAGENASTERVAEIRAQYGLDRPFLAQYAAWLGHAVQGDLSRSLLTGVPVRRAILEKLPNTIEIVVGALLVSMALGIPLGIAAATRAGSWEDGLVSALSSLGVAVPSFWLAMILVSVFALDWRLLPATGAVPFWVDPADSLRHAVLPALALGASGVAEVARQLRSALVEVLGSQFVRTLHAKGLPRRSILWRHGLKNVGVTLLTVLGLLLNRMLGATVVIEAVFAIPGIGSTVVQAALAKDLPVVQGVVLAMVVLVVCVNLAVDMLYALLDPRVAR